MQKNSKLVPLTDEQRELVSQSDWVIRWFWKKHGPAYRRFDKQDVLQAARFSLCLAARSFDESKGKWSTHACKAVSLRTMKLIFEGENLIRDPRLASRRASEAAKVYCLSDEMAKLEQTSDEVIVGCLLSECDLPSEFCAKLLARIPAREAEVISRYYGIGTIKESVKTTAMSMGVSQSRIQQIRERGIKRLRTFLENHKDFRDI